MCFVFILTENKWYIFLKKETKRHTWKGSRNGERGVWIETLKISKQATRAPIHFHHHFLSLQFVLAETKPYLADCQRPGREYCRISHQFFSPCQFQVSFSFPVIYQFRLHIRTHLLTECFCVVDVAIETTRGSRFCLVASIGYTLFFFLLLFD